MEFEIRAHGAIKHSDIIQAGTLLQTSRVSSAYHLGEWVSEANPMRLQYSHMSGLASLALVGLHLARNPHMRKTDEP